MKYTINIKKSAPTQGSLSFSHDSVNVAATCWYKDTTPIEAGKTYTGAATRMSNKQDSVTGEKRPGIFLQEFGARGIFIHEGKDVSWSDNCIVLNRDQMMTMWNHIVDSGDEDAYVIAVVVS